jgi:hypothetical protein
MLLQISLFSLFPLSSLSSHTQAACDAVVCSTKVVELLFQVCEKCTSC